MDNYAEFLARLDTAAASLKIRQTKINNALWAVRTAAEQNQFGLDEWTERKSRIRAFLRTGDPANSGGLKDLQDVATNMMAVFQSRFKQVNARLEAVQARADQINGSLHALELSKRKLTSSRELAGERARLNEAMLGLAGTGATGGNVPTPDGGLTDDLAAAREAVVMAEALLEVKGN